MKRLLFVAMLMMGLVLSTSNSVAAQDIETTNTVDFDEVSELTLDADLDALAEGIETPPAQADLPDGFLAPSQGTPENQEIIDGFSSGLGDLPEAVANASHGLDTDPDIVPGMVSAGIITYIVSDSEITGDDLSDFAGGIEEGLDEPGSPFSEGSVEEITVDGADAVLTTLIMEDSGSYAVVQMLAIPVGNTMVIATVFSVDVSPVDEADITPLTGELAVAGVAHLGNIAEDAA